jgi:hypothetical protein
VRLSTVQQAFIEHFSFQMCWPIALSIAASRSRRATGAVFSRSTSTVAAVTLASVQ